MSIFNSISYLTSHFGRIADLRRCIASVYVDHRHSKIQYEHLVILDGIKYIVESPDEYASLEKIYPGVRIIFNPLNSGKSYCMNKLISYAKFDVICFLDSDDWQFPTRSETTIQAHNCGNSIVIGSNYFTGPSNLKYINATTYPLTDADIRTEFIFFPYLLFSSLSLKRKAFIESNIFFEPSLKAGLDYEFYYRLMSVFECINISEHLVYYSQNPEGITNTGKSRLTQLNTHMNTISKILMTSIDGKPETMLISKLIIDRIAYDKRPPDELKDQANQQLKIISNNWKMYRFTPFISILNEESRERLIQKIKHVLGI